MHDEGNGEYTLILKSNTGEVSLSSYYVSYFKAAMITKVIAEEGTLLPESCENLFFDLQNCKSIDLSKANASQVKNMDYMFKGCLSL